jgi:hypothetical protein
MRGFVKLNFECAAVADVWPQLEYLDVDIPSYFAPSKKVTVDTMCLNFDQETQSYSTAKEAVEGRAASLSASRVSVLALAVAFAVLVLL